MQQLSNSFRKPTVRDEQQLVNLLKYLRGTLQYSISLQPPRRWQKAKNLELLAFTSTSWSEAGRTTSGLSLFFMGVPLVASTTNQATSRTATEFASMRMACAIAIHTKSLLQDLVIEQPFSLRVLAGGALAMQLGLTRRSRHIQLRSRFGQFQLSKVGPKQNLAATLANNSTASGLHRLLPKLKMHARAADTLALSTGRGEETAFFRSSSGSFFIGVLRKASAMSQLLSAEELLRREDVKPNNIPELAAAYATDLSLQHQCLQREELATAYAPQLRVQHQSLQEEEFVAAYSTQLSSELQILQRKELEAISCKEKTSLHQKELAWLYASQQDSSTRACHDQLDASQKSPSQSTRAYSLMPPSLTSEKELSGNELEDHLAYPQLHGKEIAKNIFLANSFGEKSLSLRKRSLEKKNFCILLSELMFLAFFAALGTMNFAPTSLQQREPVAAYSTHSLQTHSLQQDELVAAYSTDSFQSQSLQQHELVAAYVTEFSFHHQSLQQEQLVAASLAQNKSLQQNELVDHLVQLCNPESSVQSFQLILAQLCKEQLSNTSFQLSTQQLCNQDPANKSFQLTSTQLCRSSSADRAYSNKSLHQLTLSLAQSVQPEQLCSQQNANQSFQLLTPQLCFKAQVTSAWIKELQNLASTKAVADRRASHRRAFQTTSLAAAALDRPALHRGAFQQTSSAETASDTACFTARALQETGAIAAFTTRAAAPATASYIASSQQTDSATSLFAKSLVNKNFLTKQKLRTTHPHKGEHTAFPTRPSARALSTRALTRALITRALPTALTAPIALTTTTALIPTRALSTRALSTRALPTRAWPTTSLTTTRRRASYSLMSPTLLFSFRFIFRIGIFTSNSLQPSFNLDSLITCWDRELVKHDELKTSFQNELGRDQLRTACWTKKVDITNELHKHLLQKETMEHLQDDQLQHKQQQHQSKAQLQQNLCNNKKLDINQKKIACHHQEHSDVHREAAQLRELHLTKPLEDQQQKEELEKKEQLVDYKILAENQLENDNFEQRVPDRQLQQNLLQVQKQLQISNQEQLLLQQLIFEKSLDKEKPLDNELTTNFENKQSFEEALVFQSSFFGSLDFQMNFSASKGLVEKNFLNKQFFQNRLGRTPAGACKEQLPEPCFTKASGNEQPSEQLVAAEGRQRSFPARTFTSLLSKSHWTERTSPRTPLKRTACREELLPHQLLQQQLSRRDLHQDSFSDSSLTEESFRTATSQTATLRTRPSDRQLQRQQLGRRTFQNSSFEKHTFDKSGLEESSFEATSFDKSSFAANSFKINSLDRSTFEDNSFEQSSLDEHSLEKNNLARSSLDEPSFADSSFAKSIFEESSLEKNSFTPSSFTPSSLEESTFKEETFEEETFPEERFEDSSLKEETFSDTSLEEETFSESSFENNSFTANNFEKSSLEESSLEDGRWQPSNLQQNSFEQSSYQQSSFEESSFAKGTFDKSSFEESSFGTSSFDKHSFYKSNLEENSLQPNSFEDTSFEDSNFQEDSLAAKSFQRPTLTTELSQLPRQPLRTELSELERQTSSTELAEFERPTLPTEFAQLACNNLKSPALSFQLYTAQLCPTGASLSFGSSILRTRCCRGGVLREKFPFPSLTLDQLELDHLRDGTSLTLASDASPKGSFALLHLSKKCVSSGVGRSWQVLSRGLKTASQDPVATRVPT